MQKQKRKQLSQLQQQKRLRQQQFRKALQKILITDQTLQIKLDYCYDFLANNQVNNLSQYSPINISRMIYEKQLNQIKKQFDKLPNCEAKIEHFLVIMLKVMKFTIEKCPFYLIGLKSMFYEIADQGKQLIYYPAFFKYIVGQVVTMKEEDQNTQFQIKFEESKRQDHISHEGSIKKLYFSKDVKVILCLDEKAYSIKIYDQDMKNIANFTPKKQKHNKENPIIIDFDYSQMTMRIGLILSDNSISVVHLPNFLHKSQAQFQKSTLNQLVFPLTEKMSKIYYFSMVSRWLTLSHEQNHLYFYDMERVRSQSQKVVSYINVKITEMKITSVLEIIHLSANCIVAGNQVTFYNENFSQIKYSKFSHCEDISILKFSEEKNQFYVCGKQKSITVFSINKNNNTFKVWSIDFNFFINDFQIFPFFDTIVISDQKNDLRLVNQTTKVIFQIQNYNKIGRPTNPIKIYKISKKQFAIYETYQLMLSQEKIAIERQNEYNFCPYIQFDNKKEDLYISVNDQIISFSVPHGQIRKNYSIESSNLDRHYFFYQSRNAPIFIFDIHKNLYEIYQRNEAILGQQRFYRKKVNIQIIVDCFYDQQMRNLIIVSNDAINQIRNDGNNSFNSINSLKFQQFAPIVSSSFCKKSKYLTLLTSDQIFYQLKNYNHQFSKIFSFTFPVIEEDSHDRYIIQFQYDSDNQIMIILTNQNQIYLIQRMGFKDIAYINLYQMMPSTFSFIQFVHMHYDKIEQKKGKLQIYLTLTDETGFLIEIKLSRFFSQFFKNIKKQQHIIQPMFKDSQVIFNENLSITYINLHQSNNFNPKNQQFCFIKAHQKQVVILKKLKLEIICTISISINGTIKLWNQKFIVLYELKIPSLFKVVWNMSQIQNIRNKKAVDDIINLLENHFQKKNGPVSPINTYNKMKSSKESYTNKNNRYDQPANLDIQNRNLEQLIMKQDSYSISNLSKSKIQKNLNIHLHNKSIIHPWRKKIQFVNLYENALQQKKQKRKKIPKELLSLRASLDMTDRRKQTIDYKLVESFLPQIKTYVTEDRTIENINEQNSTPRQEEQLENFEACLYLKQEKRKRLRNQFDLIDKEFKKKQIDLVSKRIIFKDFKQKRYQSIDVKSQFSTYVDEKNYDPIKQVQKLFQLHNKQSIDQKRGRIISIPKIHLNKKQFQ